MKTIIFKTLSTIAAVILALANAIFGIFWIKGFRYAYGVLAVLGVVVLLSLLWDRIAKSRFVRAVDAVLSQQSQVTEPDAKTYEECLTPEPVKVEPAPQTASSTPSSDVIRQQLEEAIKAKELQKARDLEKRLREIEAEEAELLEICQRNGITK